MSGEQPTSPGVLTSLPMPPIEWPESAAEAATLLAECAKEGKAVIPFGECLAPDAGGPPARSDVALVLERISGVIAFEPDDLTITARAGTPLAEISEAIAKRRLTLPGAPIAGGTLGGLLACGWSTPGAVATHGRLRDRVLGMQVASSDGKVSRSGGRVVKNVAGLDLHRMHVGVCGAFGVITEACLRLEPMPEATRAVVLEAASLDVAEAAWRWQRTEGSDPSALSVRHSTTGVRAIAVFEGDQEPVEAMCAELSAGWARFGSVRDAAHDSEESHEARFGPLASPRQGLALTIRVPPSRVFARLSWMRERGAALELDMAAYPDLGALHVAASGPRDALGTLWESVAQAARDGAHFRIEGLPSGLRRATPAWSADPSALRMMARLKEQFDPEDTLRPGSWSAGALRAAAEYFGVAR